MEKHFFAKKPTSRNDSWDVVVVGSGPSGLTAAIYTTRGAVSTLVLGGERWGGQLMLTSVVDNFPGFPQGIMGSELMEKMKAQAIRFGAEFRAENVEKIEKQGKIFRLMVKGQWLITKSVIIATGAETMWLNVLGEKELIGRGVSSCAPCDAPFFKEKEVLVIGGGDSAMEEATILTKYAKKVTIIHRKSEFRASKTMQKKVFENKKIEVVWDSEIIEVLGKDKFEKVKIKNNKTGKVSEICADGMFVAIGHSPSSQPFKGLIDLDEKGYIKQSASNSGQTTSYKTATNVPGIFVSGDVQDYTYKQAITAAGFGCQAAIDTLSYLDNINKKSEN